MLGSGPDSLAPESVIQLLICRVYVHSRALCIQLLQAVCPRVYETVGKCFVCVRTHAWLHGCVHTWEYTCVQTHACTVDRLCTRVDTCSHVCIHSVPVGVCSGRHARLGTRCGFVPRRDGGISGRWRSSEGSRHPPFPHPLPPSPHSLPCSFSSSSHCVPAGPLSWGGERQPDGESALDAAHLCSPSWG